MARRRSSTVSTPTPRLAADALLRDGTANSRVGRFGWMRLRGVRARNLDGLDLDLPRGCWVAITGPTGAGKTTLARDVLHAEGRRRYIETFPAASRRAMERLERPDADTLEGIPTARFLSATDAISSGRRTSLARVVELRHALATLFSLEGVVVCPDCRVSIRPRSATDLAHLLAQLPEGTRYAIGFPVEVGPNVNRQVALDTLRAEGYTRVVPWDRAKTQFNDRVRTFEDEDLLKQTCREWWVIVDRLIRGNENPARRLDSLSTALARGGGLCRIVSDALPNGAIDARNDWRCPSCARMFLEPTPPLFFETNPLGACPVCRGVGRLDDQGRPDPHGSAVCGTCQGLRLRSESLAVRLEDANLLEWEALTVEQMTERLMRPVTNVAASSGESPRTTSARRRALAILTTLDQLGLGHLPLDRPCRDLARGEATRAILAGAIASGLSGLLWVLDEPSTGLHPCDIRRLSEALGRTRDQGQSLVVVDHDPDLIRAADWVIELGPGSGSEGGRVVFQGTPDQLAQADTPTGRLIADPSATPWAVASQPPTLSNSPPDSARFSRARKSSRPRFERPPDRPWLRLTGARGRNLRGIDISIPLGGLTLVTGVSGAGKRTLVLDVLAWAVAEAIRIQKGPSADANPRPRAHESVGFEAIEGCEHLEGLEVIASGPPIRSPRSCPAGVLGIAGELRRVFAATPLAKQRGYPAAFFGIGSTGGRCSTCKGLGVVTLDLAFLPDVSATCPDCGGKRFRPEILDVTYQNRSIADILDLTIREGFALFKNKPKIQARLRAPLELGLDHLRLGQPLTSLSDGEARRLRLAGFLATSPAAVERSSRGPKSLFLVEEPIWGLHRSEWPRVLDRLRSLPALGHTLVATSSRPELEGWADWVIELGPGAGDRGGRVIFQGPPRVSSTPSRHNADHTPSLPQS